MVDSVRPGNDGAFAIEVDYRPGTDAPSRVFRALSDMVDAVEHADRVLVRSLAANLVPVVLLEDIQKGSIFAWFRSALKDVPDETLQSGELKRVVGHYLVKAKRAIISWEGRHTTIESRQEVDELRNEILSLAEETGINRIPAYAAPAVIDLVEVATEFKNAAAQLGPGEEMRFLDAGGESTVVSKTFAIAPDRLEELVTQNVVSNTVRMILKVKKPDFLGSSQWELRHGNRSIVATIEDADWLEKFHERDPSTAIMPGDAIQAIVRVDASYGFDGELVRESYGVEKIIRVVKPSDAGQMTLGEAPER